MKELIKSGNEKRIMTAAVLYGKNDVRIERLPVPDIGRGEVLVRIKAALTCGTDLKTCRQGFHERMITPPSVFGHELSGVIEEVGEGVDGFKPGMRVVAANSGPCNECFFCRKNQANLCENLQFINGAYAEFIKIPELIVRQNLLILPDSVDFEEAAMVEPLACVLRAVEQMGIKEGDTVALIGTGPIGLMFVQTLKSQGARVIALDKEAYRLNAAKLMGADHVLDPTRPNAVRQVRNLTDGNHGADFVIEAVGLKETWRQAMKMIRRGGTVNLFGGCPSGTRIPLDSTFIHYSEITIRASFHHTPKHIRAALNAIHSGCFNAKSLITGRENLASLGSALERLLNGTGDLKIAIIP